MDNLANVPIVDSEEGYYVVNLSVLSEFWRTKREAWMMSYQELANFLGSSSGSVYDLCERPYRMSSERIRYYLEFMLNRGYSLRGIILAYQPPLL